MQRQITVGSVVYPAEVISYGSGEMATLSAVVSGRQVTARVYGPDVAWVLGTLTSVLDLVATQQIFTTPHNVELCVK